MGGIDHTSLNVTDIEVAKKQYLAALKPLGYKFSMEFPEAKVFGLSYPCSMFFGLVKFEKPDFWVSQGEVGRGVHIAFAATKKQVDEFYEAAIAAGFQDNGAPGYRNHYHKGYYAAFVKDNDGNNIEAVCHRA